MWSHIIGQRSSVKKDQRCVSHSRFYCLSNGQFELKSEEMSAIYFAPKNQDTRCLKFVGHWSSRDHSLFGLNLMPREFIYFWDASMGIALQIVSIANREKANNKSHSLSVDPIVVVSDSKFTGIFEWIMILWMWLDINRTKRLNQCCDLFHVWRKITRSIVITSVSLIEFAYKIELTQKQKFFIHPKK